MKSNVLELKAREYAMNLEEENLKQLFENVVGLVGAGHVSINQLRALLDTPSTYKWIPDTNADSKNVELVEMRNTGKSLVEKKRFVQAMKLFGQIIEMDNISTDTLCVSLSNRSLCCISFAEEKCSKDDEKFSTPIGSVKLLQLVVIDCHRVLNEYPAWYKPNLRLAQAYWRLGQLEKACLAYRAYLLCPSDPVVVQFKEMMDQIHYSMYYRGELHAMENMLHTLKEDQPEPVFVPDYVYCPLSDLIKPSSIHFCESYPHLVESWDGLVKYCEEMDTEVETARIKKIHKLLDWSFDCILNALMASEQYAEIG